MHQFQHPLKVLPHLLLMLLLSSAFNPLFGSDGRRPRVFLNLGCNSYTYRDPNLKASITANVAAPEQLDATARLYAKQHKLNFDFGRSEARIFILRSTNYLACAWYAPSKGQPALLCMFDFDRRVVNHGVGTATRAGDELPRIVLGVDAVRVESGIAGGVTNLLSPERVASLVGDLVREQNVEVDFEIQQTIISVPLDHRYLTGSADLFGNYRADIWFRVDFDGDVSVKSISTVLASKSLEITEEGKLKRTAKAEQ